MLRIINKHFAHKVAMAKYFCILSFMNLVNPSEKKIISLYVIELIKEFFQLNELFLKL